jgi:glycosyltransferase involved in cell wall biosynthesis
VKVLFITQYDERGASSRCRVYQYLPSLASRGIEGEVLPRFPAARELWRRAGAADAVFLQKRVPSLTRLLLLRGRAPRLLFDFDDAIWLRGASGGKVRPAPLRKRLRLAATLRLSNRVIAGNEYLAAYARRWTPRVTVLPTPVDTEYYRRDQGSGARGQGPASELTSSGHQVITPSSLRLGWVGHPSTLGYLRRLEPALAGLARRYPELRLRVVCSEPYESEAIPVENVPWALAEEAANLRSLDIGLMPLDDDPWARGKCGYKALQYMAVGVPVVCSPVGMNVNIIQEGENGLLASDPDAWERQISRLVESSELRQRLGAAGQRSVEQNYSLTLMAERLADLIAGMRDEG